MKKDKEWLKEEIWKQNVVMDKGYIYTDDLMSIINEVDEPEVKQLDKKIRELESYNDELIRDNNQLRNALDNQEFFSQEWIDENKIARINDVRKMTTSDVVTVEKLQNLLVPKQEEVDRAYKDGYEKGKQHTFYKGYLEGLADKNG